MSEEINELRGQVDHLEERVTELEHRLDGQDPPEADQWLRGFVESFEPTSHTERSLCVAYYLETHRNRDNFTVSNIEEGYRDCRVKPAGNMSDVLGRMNDQDWLLRDGTDGQTQLWRVSARGQEVVLDGVNNDS